MQDALTKLNRVFIMSTSHTCFNFVIDSLDFRLWADAPPSREFEAAYPSWLNYLEACRRDHDFRPPQFNVEIPHVGSFVLHPTAKRPYQFVLKNPTIGDIRIWSPAKWHSATQTGHLYISLRSQFLQYQRLSGVSRLIAAIREYFYGSSVPQLGDYCRISRVDLAADVSHPGFSLSDLPNFLSPAKHRDQFLAASSVDSALQLLDSKLSSEHAPQPDNKGALNYNLSREELEQIRLSLVAAKVLSDSYDLSRTIGGVELETFYFGRFTSPLYARIYNKCLSLAPQSKEYMKEVWSSNGWDGTSNIWRVEFSLSGDFLKRCVDIEHSVVDEKTGELQADLREFDDFCKSISAIWAYLTHSWLRESVPNGDSNRWRWPISDFWAVVQNACNFSVPVQRVDVRPRPDSESLMAQFRGLFASLLATKMENKSDSSSQLGVISTMYEWLESLDFQLFLSDRRIKLGLDDFTNDTLFSAALRSEQLSLGFGS